MQGRLLPKYKNRFQAHPKDNWKKEFNLAKKLGLDCIEFIFDYEHWYENPLMTHHGLDDIYSLSKKTNVSVLSVCADYFMEQPIFCSSLKTQNQQRLTFLAQNCEKIGVKDIVIPFVDNSSLLNNSLNIDKTISFFKEFLHQNEFNLNFTLETDLPPQQFLSLVQSIDNDHIKINYDIGNSASLGYNFCEELETYGAYISNIHIKDRVKNGGSIELGKGAAQFTSFFTSLKKYKFNGIFILQAFREDDALISLKPQLEYIRKIMTKAFSN